MSRFKIDGIGEGVYENARKFLDDPDYPTEERMMDICAALVTMTRWVRGCLFYLHVGTLHAVLYKNANVHVRNARTARTSRVSSTMSVAGRRSSLILISRNLKCPQLTKYTDGPDIQNVSCGTQLPEINFEEFERIRDEYLAEQEAERSAASEQSGAGEYADHAENGPGFASAEDSAVPEEFSDTAITTDFEGGVAGLSQEADPVPNGSWQSSEEVFYEAHSFSVPDEFSEAPFSRNASSASAVDAPGPAPQAQESYDGGPPPVPQFGEQNGQPRATLPGTQQQHVSPVLVPDGGGLPNTAAFVPDNSAPRDTDGSANTQLHQRDTDDSAPQISPCDSDKTVSCDSEEQQQSGDREEQQVLLAPDSSQSAPCQLIELGERTRILSAQQRDALPAQESYANYTMRRKREHALRQFGVILGPPELYQYEPDLRMGGGYVEDVEQFMS